MCIRWELGLRVVLTAILEWPYNPRLFHLDLELRSFHPPKALLESSEEEVSRGAEVQEKAPAREDLEETGGRVEGAQEG